MKRILGTTILAILLLLPAAVPAAAAAPSNDEIATPTVIGSLPYADTIDTTDATTGPTDPGYCEAGDEWPPLATVWYRYTATADGPLGAVTFGSDYPTTLHVGTADGNGGIDVLACNVQNGGTEQSAIRFEAEAGVTYLFAVGADPFAEVNGGRLVFSLDVAGPALVTSIEIEPTATIVRDGVAVVRGSFACNVETTFSTVVFVEMYQVVNGVRTVFGFGYADIEGCPSDGLPFEIEVSDESPFRGENRANRPFVPGPVAVQVTAGGCYAFGCDGGSTDLVLDLVR